MPFASLGHTARAGAWSGGWTSWTLPDDTGERWPILDDGHDEEPEAWASDYTIWDPQNDEWHFLDGERCANENLRAVFARRDNEKSRH